MNSHRTTVGAVLVCLALLGLSIGQSWGQWGQGPLVRLNLHTHSNVSATATSYTNADTPAALLLRAKTIGLGGVAITDYAEEITSTEWSNLLTTTNGAPSGLIALRGFEWGMTGPGGVINHINVIGSSWPARANDGGEGAGFGALKPTLADFYGWLTTSAYRAYGGPVVAQFNHLALGSSQFDMFSPPDNLAAVNRFLTLAELAVAPGLTTTDATATSILRGEWFYRQALVQGWLLAPTLGADNNASLTDTARRYHTGVYLMPGAAVSAANVLIALGARRTFASQDANAEVILRTSWDFMGMRHAATVPSPLTLKLLYKDPDDAATASNLAGGSGLIINGVLHALSATTAKDDSYWRWTVSKPLPAGSYWIYARLRQADGDYIFSAPIWMTLSNTKEQYRFVRKFGEAGAGDGQFSSARGVAVGADRSAYVADTANNRVQRFRPSGAYLSQWGGAGTGNGKFNSPYGITCNRVGETLVADTNNHRIQRFKADGTFIAAFGGYGDEDGKFRGPFALCTDSFNNIYVADATANRIQKFNSNGRFLTKWGTPGSGDGELNGPLGIATDAAGFVYVADTGNDRIQKFTSSGAYVTQWGGTGTGDGKLSWPVGIGTDSCGHVYVADHDNNRVQKFTSTGTFLAKWGTFGTEDGQFDGPTGLAVDDLGYIYVMDTGNNRVQVFEVYAGRPATVAAPQVLTVSALSAVAAPGGKAQIVFALSSPARVDVQIANIAGRVVRVLRAGTPADPGLNTVAWDGLSANGLRVPSGRYLVRVLARNDDGQQAQALAPCTITR